MTTATRAFALPAGLRLSEARRRVAQALEAAGVPDAALDARIFIEDATGLGAAALMAETPLDPAATATLEAWVARRLAGEPVFRIIGRREFWGLDLAVTPDVLDPRPDTETIVEAALRALGPRRTAPLRICDLGTGSGAILAALLSECRQARGWGVDRSRSACGVARHNLAGLGLDDRALVLQGSWGAALPEGGFDLVASNPPYIETAVIPTLATEVRDHDPALALDGGPDGLACYRLIAADLPRLLAPGGIAVLEVGAGQAAAVADLMRQAGLVEHDSRRDLGGHERAVLARRAG
ncbi:peptide chain release factor N(5)-glutamine methyltransferase [Lichenihabitans sp. Uapishka_5]|uniref:peptide chain release factor N(5)-glutamine methyltransferase n=1 Tax=Lichenihabitans sp. Uapishka_5 TaxID=3037302 RepID=UPI0029E7FF96|nr:peptide chain release factor N(5)-glutamine methyltransferase [Lichenihabitans sp. Uapishka_5]MDX7951410.1 peptide chain release factor N(5)-glutamine methyltransferase [Lichenihabitans sp. Uapishka_5]